MRGVSWAEREALSARVKRVRVVSLFMGTGYWGLGTRDGSTGERRKEKGERRIDGAIGVTPFHSSFSILQFEFILLAF